MIKKLTLITLAVLFSTQALADEYAQKYFSSSSNPKLNTQEAAGLAISRKYSSDGSMAIKPTVGDNGSVRYMLNSNPSIVCAVLQVCDIALQPGENVNSINLGDTARWNIEPAKSGSGLGETFHILVKPLDAGLTTTLFIATDRRTYHIRLKSHKTQYMPAVAFSYPDENQAKWNQYLKRDNYVREATTLSTGQNTTNLNFNYTMSGETPRWKPVRVYNDGSKTYLEMPSTLSQGEAPTLLIMQDGEQTLVNYRVEGNRYIVDSLFDSAILITGVGKNQTKVTVRYNQ